MLQVYDLLLDCHQPEEALFLSPQIVAYPYFTFTVLGIYCFSNIFIFRWEIGLNHIMVNGFSHKAWLCTMTHFHKDKKTFRHKLIYKLPDPVHTFPFSLLPLLSCLLLNYIKFVQQENIPLHFWCPQLQSWVYPLQN